MNNKIIQKLNNYTEKYLNYEKWLKKETDHYIFYYLKNTTSEKDMNQISKRQENAFKKIINFLKIKPPKNKIKYYIYPTEKIKKELMGDDGYAQAIYHNKTIHIIYNKNINPLGEHEDTHLLSLPWGLSIGFLQEGLAEYMTGERKWHNKEPSFFIKKIFKENIMPPFQSLMSHKNWINLPDKNMPYYYVISASFMKFLIEKFGKKCFIKLYKNTERENSASKNIKIFKDIYKISIGEVEKIWREKHKV